MDHFIETRRRTESIWECHLLISIIQIGCEILKNMAAMGIACGPSGMIHITDMDGIFTLITYHLFSLHPGL